MNFGLVERPWACPPGTSGPADRSKADAGLYRRPAITESNIILRARTTIAKAPADRSILDRVFTGGCAVVFAVILGEAGRVICLYWI
jgi:hypothetical protein